MTERGQGDVTQSRDGVVIGPSSVQWDGQAFVIRFDETTAGFPVPIKHRVRGTVRVFPKAFTPRAFELDQAGRHIWWPAAPVSRVEVELQEPALRWSGEGYIDSNRGAESLEAGFSHWHWCRAPLDGGAAVLYDVETREGKVDPLALRFDARGEVDVIEGLSVAQLPRTVWQVKRATRADAGATPRAVKTLEDSPFYARSLLETTLAGKRTPAIHESLSLDRFNSPIVKRMLPFKMPRAAK
jgi:carotenoid 1,2-hydratase